jgi:hypothetical protein
VAKPFTIGQYMEKVLVAKNELETFTGQRWSVPQGEELQRTLSDEQHKIFAGLPGYEYLVYLRHHGYPSPLLDWTESPYIAAYFALSDETGKNSAVYCYVERPRGTKGGVVGDAKIHVRGPMVTSDKRHFAQKAWYTTATRWDYANEEHVFCPHEDVFQRNDERQDVLLKIVLAPSIRRDGVRRLNDYNINHFTLFQTEDSLVRALDHRHFDVPDV